MPSKLTIGITDNEHGTPREVEVQEEFSDVVDRVSAQVASQAEHTMRCIYTLEDGRSYYCPPAQILLIEQIFEYSEE